MQKMTFILLLLSLSSSALADDFAKQRLDHWHQWRGPNANGFAPNGDPPTEWSESKNVKWKVEIPGKGSSTPVVWADRIFVLTAVKTDRKPRAPDKALAKKEPSPKASSPHGRRPGFRGFGGFRMSTPTPTTLYKFEILCLDRNTGKVIWRKTAIEEIPHEGHHPSHGYASASPTTDGKFLYASFGSRGIFCYDLEGNLQWKRDLGDMQTKIGFGEGTSPVVHGDSLIVNWDHEGESFITCLNAKTGKEKWRVARDERTTWVTPLVVERGGVTQVVTNASNRARSYDLATGKLIWQCGGQTSNPIPSPVALGGTVFCMTGFRGYALYAIPLNAKGDITDTDKIIWRHTDAAPYVASPLLYGDLLYFTKERKGILSCVDAKTGKEKFTNQRLTGIGTLYASLVGAAGKVYIAGRDGTTVVVKHGPKFKVLATNKLDEGMNASPVIVGKQLLLKGNKHLYCIAAEKTD